MYAAVLEQVLLGSVLSTDRPVAAICLGLGDAGEPPGMDLLLRFMGAEPPLYGSRACTRSIDPATSLPVVQTLDGAPGLFLSMLESPRGSGRLVTVRVERTGSSPLTLRCRVDMARRAPSPDARPDVPPVVPPTMIRIRGC